MMIGHQGGLDPLPRSDTLAERVRDALRKGLIDGAFAPGELIKIRDVAVALGVSPTPAREALMHLIAEGALLADTNKTALVPALTEESLREITALRISLESAAAEAALPAIGADDLATIEAHDAAGLDAIRAGDMKKATECNAAFHFAIYAKAHMPLMVRMIETVWLRSGAYLAVAKPVFESARCPRNNHGRIIEAIRLRDAAALRAAIETDIRSTDEVLVESLRRHLDAPKPARRTRVAKAG